jgi:hypothetical protein
MNMQPSRSFRNPLLRRVQHHASMSVLFSARQAEPLFDHPDGRVEPPAINQAGFIDTPATAAPLANAVPISWPELVKPARAPVTTALAGSHPAAKRTAPAVSRSSDARAADLNQPVASVVPLQLSSTTSAGSHPQPEGPASPPPGSQNASESKIEDSTWRRLQAIFRKHNEQREVQASASLESGTEASQPGSASQAEREADSELQQPPARTDSAEVGSPLQAESLGEIADDSETAPPSIEHISPSAQTIQRVARQETEVDSALPPGQMGQPPPDIGAVSAGSPPLVSQEPDLSSWYHSLPAGHRMSTQPLVGSLQDRHKLEPPARMTESPVPVAGESSGSDLKESPGGQDPSPALQPLPLEAVWAMQQRELANPQPSSQMFSEYDFPTAMVPGLASEASASGGKLHSLLQKLEPGRPTGSPVEVIPPRQPRPGLAPGKPPVGSGDDTVPHTFEGESVPPETPSTIQRMSSVETTLPAGVPEPNPMPESDLVETKIGPLPADLWLLLGQSPPAQQFSTRPAKETNFPAQVRAPAVQLPASNVPDIPAVAVPEAGIQRTAAEEASLPSAPITTPPPAAGSPAEPDMGLARSEGELDLAYLASQVYVEVKRRMAIELERDRRRF